MVSHSNLICIFLITNEAEHLFLCRSTILDSSSVEFIFLSFTMHLHLIYCAGNSAKGKRKCLCVSPFWPSLIVPIVSILIQAPITLAYVIIMQYSSHWSLSLQLPHHQFIWPGSSSWPPVLTDYLTLS